MWVKWADVDKGCDPCGKTLASHRTLMSVEFDGRRYVGQDITADDSGPFILKQRGGRGLIVIGGDPAKVRANALIWNGASL